MKKLLAIILIFAMCFTLCSCYDSKEISQIAFIIAVGFDEDSYSFQIVKPSAFEGESSEDSPLLTKTVTAPNVFTAMDKLNSSISERCDYSHIKMVIFSHAKLKKGIEKEVGAMLKSNDFHPNTRIAMCDGKASEYMSNMEIPLDANPAEYYENIFRKNYTEYYPDVKLKDFQKAYKGQVMGNVMPIIGTEGGMAVTRNFKMAEFADGEDVLIYNLLKERDFEGNFSVADNTVISLKKKAGMYNVDLSGSTPLISVKIQLEGNIVWSENKIDKKAIEVQAKEKAESDITEFLYRCSTSYKADIFDFHRHAKINYLTLQNWENEDWQSLFENADYNVSVDINIKREGLNKE